MSAATTSSLSVPPLRHSWVLSWEEKFNFNASVDFFGRNWYAPLVIGIAIYLPVLYVGQLIMKNREPFKLKTPLVLWNFGLATFSAIGFSRALPEMLHSLKYGGFHYSICNNSVIRDPPARFWLCLFVLSKVPELLDTVFLVLKKQKLIFLHVYHHASVLVFCWFMYAQKLSTTRWFYTMNYGVHMIMYSYFALKAFPNIIRIPKAVSMLITFLQTLQMVMGTFVILMAYLAKLKGPCDIDMPMTIFGLIIYVSYLYLFSRFFFQAYCSTSSSKEVTKKHN